MSHNRTLHQELHKNPPVKLDVDICSYFFTPSMLKMIFLIKARIIPFQPFTYDIRCLNAPLNPLFSRIFFYSKWFKHTVVWFYQIFTGMFCSKKKTWGYRNVIFLCILIFGVGMDIFVISWKSFACWTELFLKIPTSISIILTTMYYVLR